MMTSDLGLEIPEPENCSTKEVYAFFGLASYQAQVLEKGITIMVVAFKCRNFHITRNKFDSIYSKHNKKHLVISLLGPEKQ